MTALAQIATQFPKNRVMGQAGMLDTARFTHFVAEELKVEVASVKTLTLGSHGDTMVPVPSRCTVNGKPLADFLPQAKIDELVDRTRNGGAEVVALLKTGSAYYAPSAAAARMAKAVKEDSGAVMPVCAWVDGEYGISGVYLGVEAEIGKSGIRKVVESALTPSEVEALKSAAEAVRAGRGAAFVRLAAGVRKPGADGDFRRCLPGVVQRGWRLAAGCGGAGFRDGAGRRPARASGRCARTAAGRFSCGDARRSGKR